MRAYRQLSSMCAWALLASACAQSTTPPRRDVDVLFVVDNGGSGFHVASVLAATRLLDALQTGDLDGDGVAELRPVDSLHLGLVSGDMAPASSTHCALGADGVLQPSDGRCGPFVGPRIVAWPDDPYDTGRYASCTLPELDAQPHSTGCWHQQPLEAALKALAPAPAADGTSSVDWTVDGYRPPTFVDGSFAHGGLDPDGNVFLRDDSVLVVIVLTGLDDCSTPDPAAIEAEPSFLPVQHCLAEAAAGHLYPVQRYVDGLAGLRRDPSRLVVASFVGLPPGSEGLSPDELLALPEMHPTDFVRVCESAVPGWALAGTRYVELTRDLVSAGARAHVYSGCADRLDGPVEQLVRDVVHAVDGVGSP